MKANNKTGLNTEPCGTAAVTNTWEDFHFQTKVRDLFDRNALI